MHSLKTTATFSQLNVFAAVAESGSLSAAAKTLNLSPSAVSKSLAQLEERLGVLLIKRTTRSMVLTEVGESILVRTNHALSEVEEVVDAARQKNERIEGELRITSSIAFGSRQLTCVIGKYLASHPGVQVHVDLDDRFANLSDESFDIALRVTASTDWNYAARKISTVRWVYCAAPEYLRRHPPIVIPQDVVRHQCLVDPAMTVGRCWEFENAGLVQQVAILPRMTSNSSVVLRSATLAGNGLACLPTYLVSSDIASGALKRVLPNFEPPSKHSLYAMYYRSRHRNPVIRSFIDFLVREIGDPAPWDESLIAAEAGQPLAA
ncbi:LysR family transcriptional regulator [Pseudorhodoferax soli]|uniref:DNA-binding transcriptional LysR family regulator n=1 Tax=Pseudorhodoferax soli TaxID=545864 RepID=A0A368XL27_9BURK|nr:LysR family transcriptional regulator [Pseudorhodoferax soli]RCW68682.1 DNA-binding transcriptional LysR family regulator [Pseudorhodoferax soli]